MIVCLVYPPAAHMIKTNVPSFVDEVTGCYPPLGILYVAGAIAREGVHEVHVIDAVAENLDSRQLEERLRRLGPDLVGIEAITFSILDAYETARIVKRMDPAIPVLMGGPHVNLFPEETLSLSDVDYLLLGEAENTINPFLAAVRDQSKLPTVPGVVCRDEDGSIKFGPPNPLIEDLDSLPTPARHLLDNTRYGSVLGRGRYLTTLMSSRGCPAKCIFCDRPHLGKKFRARSAGNVVQEMRQCAEAYGIDEFFFYDDTFTIDRQRVFDICREARESGLKASWDIRARVSNMDRPMLEALREAGCRRIHFGIESGNPEVLRRLQKGVDLDRAREILAACRKIGIETLAYFMIGSPGEGPSEIRDTANFALSIDCDYIHVAVTTPFPGTELYRMGLKSGLYKKDYWREFARHPTPEFVPELWEEHLTREELIRSMQDLYRRFYGRPSHILRQLFKVRSVSEFSTKAGAGIRLFFGAKPS